MKNKQYGEYREMMERECFSKEEKENMVRKLMQSSMDREIENSDMSGENSRAKRFGVRGVVAACLIGCLFITGVAGASAAGLLKSVPDVFAKVFRLTDGDRDLADKMGKPLGESVVSNGIRVTADAIIADSYSYAVVFSIEREDEKPLDEGQKLASDEWGFSSADMSPLGWGEGFYSYDETPEDSSIQFVMMASNHHKIKAGDNISIQLSDLCHFKKGNIKDYTVKGNWSMELSIPEPSDELVVKGQTVELEGNSFTIENINISPISQILVFSINADSGLSLKDGARLLDNCVMELEFKDGERIDLGKGGSGVVSKGKRFQFVYGDNFESLVHLEDIKAIHIGKLEIPVQVK